MDAFNVVCCRIIIPSLKKFKEGVYRSHCVGLAVCRSAGNHILSGLFLTNYLVEFNKILLEGSIPRGDVNILRGFQLHVILQSCGPFYAPTESPIRGAYSFWPVCLSVGLSVCTKKTLTLAITFEP